MSDSAQQTQEVMDSSSVFILEIQKPGVKRDIVNEFERRGNPRSIEAILPTGQKVILIGNYDDSSRALVMTDSASIEKYGLEKAKEVENHSLMRGAPARLFAYIAGPKLIVALDEDTTYTNDVLPRNEQMLTGKMLSVYVPKFVEEANKFVDKLKKEGTEDMEAFLRMFTNHILQKTAIGRKMDDRELSAATTLIGKGFNHLLLKGSLPPEVFQSFVEQDMVISTEEFESSRQITWGTLENEAINRIFDRYEAIARHEGLEGYDEAQRNIIQNGSLADRKVLADSLASKVREFLGGKNMSEAYSPEDMLDVLVLSGTSVEDCRTHIIGNFLGGTETSPLSLVTVTYNMFKYPAILQQIKNEIQEKIGDKRLEDITIDDLRSLTGLRNWIRINNFITPVSIIIPRTGKNDIPELSIKAGDLIFLFIHGAHRWMTRESLGLNLDDPQVLENLDIDSKTTTVDGVNYDLKQLPQDRNFGRERRVCKGMEFFYLDAMAFIVSLIKSDVDLEIYDEGMTTQGLIGGWETFAAKHIPKES